MILKTLNPEAKKTLLRMIVIGAGTLVIGVVFNEFIGYGIRLPILIRSIPVHFSANAVKISPEQALQLLNEKKAAFVDLRSADEFDMDHISGALSIPVVDFLSNPGSLNNYTADKNLTAVLYSAKKIDDNTELFARFLLKKGVSQVKVLDGGFEQWSNKEYPVEF